MQRAFSLRALLLSASTHIKHDKLTDIKARLQQTARHMSTSKWNYPVARRGDAINEYPHGKTVPDPYRWLEEPDSKETKAFVESQNVVSQAYIKKDGDGAELRKAIEAMYSFEKFSAPSKKVDGFWYYSYNPNILAQSQIWRCKNLDRSDAELFFDPNKLSADGTIALSGAAFSKDARLFAYSTSKSGSDNQSIYVKDTDNLDTLQKRDDEILYVKFSSISWTKDNKGFAYHRYPEKDNTGTGTAADVDSALYYHALGTPQAKDRLLHNDSANPHHMFGSQVSHDGKYLIITTSQGTEHTNKLHIAKLDVSLGMPEALEKKCIVDDFHASFDYVTNYDNKFVFMTNENAPKNKIVVYDMDDPAAGFKDLVAESTDVLDSCDAVNKNKLILTYTHDVKQEVSIYSFDGKFESKLELPLGLAVYSNTMNHDSTEFFISVGGFTTPLSLYRYDFTDSSLTLYRETSVPGVNPSDFETEQVFFPSKDGTKIPMFITGRKGLPKDGTTPCLQYGYGGFEISVVPSFSIMFLMLMRDFNARVAVVNIRGGGEYGHAWWEAAIKERRQTAYDDFQAATKYLSSQHYTSPSKLAIYGGSNGGLLCGVCLNQQPQLYGAVLATVGVMDMLRFHKFTIGSAWTSDFGSPDDPEMFDYIKGYSPLHNVNPVAEYPATLLLTADHDDRVVPCHTLKFIAELQHVKPNNDAPLIVRVEKDAGHGAGKPTAKKIDEIRDQLQFLQRALAIHY